MRKANSNTETAAIPAAAPVTGPYFWLVTGVLSLAMLGMNHDYDVKAGRYLDAATSGGSVVQQEQFEKSVINTTQLRKLGFLALVAAAGLALIGPKTNASLRLNVLTALAAATLAFALASWCWSTARNETLRELVRLAMATATVCLLVRRFDVRELVWMIVTLASVSIIVDCAVDLAAGTFQPWKTEFRLGGTLHPNHMARLGLTIAIFGYVAMSEIRFRHVAWLWIAAGVIVVVMSYSRSGLFSLLAAVVAVKFLGITGRRFALYGAVGLTLVAVGAICYAAMPHSLRYDLLNLVLMGRTEDAGSLTGRMPLWQEIWKDVAERFWIGHGYSAYWTADRNYEIASILEWHPHHSHSAYMETFVDLGFIGLLLVLSIALLSLSKCSHWAATTGRFEYRFLGALFVAGLVNCFFEVGFCTPRFEGLFLGIGVCLLAMGKPEIAPAAEHSRSLFDFGQIAAVLPPGESCPT